MRRFSSQRFRLKTEMRRITGRPTRRGARKKKKPPSSKKKALFGGETVRFSKRGGVTYLMFRVRGEELQRADGEPELVRVRELPDAHAEGNQLVARDARRPFHDILADVIHALFFLVRVRDTAERERVNERSFERSRARDDAPSKNACCFSQKAPSRRRRRTETPKTEKDVVEAIERGTAVTEKNLGNVASLFVDGSAEEIQP